MTKIHTKYPLFQAFALLMMLFSTASSKAQDFLYSWQSPNGTVEEKGGKLEHFNQNGHDLRNIKCGDYYTFVLNGNRLYVNAGYNVDECSYMKITLDGVNVFREGDEIEITAMRNNVADRSASIYFLFHTAKEGAEKDVPLIDPHVWNNLGQGKDDTFNGGIGGNAKEKVASFDASSQAAASLSASSFTPSTYTFVVPKEANGAKYVRLTRYETGNMLYISSFIVHRSTSSSISAPKAESKPAHQVRKYMREGRVVLTKDGKLYDANGSRFVR